MFYLQKITEEMNSDLSKDTVDMIPNFDDTTKEPSVLPAKFPFLLCNGTTGIAVGMATNMPTHNLREVAAAISAYIDNKDITIDELMHYIKGPDFPTGATILGTRGIEEAYRTGRGKIRVRAVTDIEPMANGKNRIIVTELPFMVNKARLIEKIAELVRDKKIDGITALEDQSSREGMRICIELRRDVNANVILNQLYKHTQLQDTFGEYKVVPINSYEEAYKYGNYTAWCVTHTQGNYNGYTSDGSRFFFCLKNGFENVRKKRGEVPCAEAVSRILHKVILQNSWWSLPGRCFFPTCCRWSITWWIWWWWATYWARWACPPCRWAAT